MLKLNIRAFFFNAQTDYLPYYKNFTLNIERDKKVIDVLNMIKEKNPDFSFPNSNIILKINELVVTADENISTIAKELGKELQIDPALAYRSNNGLILNDSDFMQSFELLSEFTNEEDRAYYQTLYPVHYASSSFEYNHEYIGDAILLLASRLIERNPEDEYAIINTINDEFKGIDYCEYENNVFKGQDHAQTIHQLKEKVATKAKKSLLDRVCDLAIKKRSDRLDNDTISEEKIALYVGSRNDTKLIAQTKEQIEQRGATFLEFPMSTRLAGQTVISSNIELAHQKAGKMLLEALDYGATSLLFSKEEDFKLFNSMRAKCERTVGRPIDLKLISLDKLPIAPTRVEA